MELILIKPVRKVGQIGDIIKVKNGYGRNLLIPKKFAIRATEKNKRVFDEQRKSLEEKNHQLYIQAQEIGRLLEGKELIFIRQAAEDGKLFGSVSNKEIAINLSELTGATISYSQIYLQKLIKYVGLYNVEVVLHPEQVVNIKLGVGRTETEAKSVLKNPAEDIKNEVTDLENTIAETEDLGAVEQNPVSVEDQDFIQKEKE